MHVYLLTKDTGKVPHKVVHLYEHWFIMFIYRRVYNIRQPKPNSRAVALTCYRSNTPVVIIVLKI
ncbi:MAG TPA: hypothetical protein VK978_03855, partial [Candidatus Saccharimonadales bacterium]|nr:hypothetical protein [Candidatus Saccharimonadales bacterium]